LTPVAPGASLRSLHLAPLVSRPRFALPTAPRPHPPPLHTARASPALVQRLALRARRIACDPLTAFPRLRPGTCLPPPPCSARIPPCSRTWDISRLAPPRGSPNPLRGCRLASDYWKPRPRGMARASSSSSHSAMLALGLLGPS